MAYYVSAQQGTRKVLVAGPFRRHGDALAALPHVKNHAKTATRDGRDYNVAWGTARDPLGHAPGKLAVPGLEPDADGYLPRPDGTVPWDEHAWDWWKARRDHRERVRNAERAAHVAEAAAAAVPFPADEIVKAPWGSHGGSRWTVESHLAA